jgi:hypothetical protein
MNRVSRILSGVIVLSVVVSTIAGGTSYALTLSDEYSRQSNDILYSNANATNSPSGKFVYYSQKDPKWAQDESGNPFFYSPADGTTIYQAGCGPTSLAMIVATLIDSTVTPVVTARMGYAGGSFISGVGTRHANLLDSVSAKYPFNQTPMTGESIDVAMEFVDKQGGYVYMGGEGPPPFTGSGHVVVIRDVDIAAGTVTIADPWRGEADVYPKSTIDAYKWTTIGITKR